MSAHLSAPGSGAEGVAPSAPAPSASPSALVAVLSPPDAAGLRQATIEGLTLTVDPQGEAKVRDLDYARFLGFAQPRDIRKLIRRHERSGLLGTIDWRDPTDGNERHGGARSAPSNERHGGARSGNHNPHDPVAHLTEAQALALAAKSETKTARALLQHVIAVFIAVRRGLVAPPPVAAPAALDHLATQIGAARGVLAQVSWTLGLPSAHEAAPSTALAAAAPAALGAEVEALAADAGHLARLVGLDPSTGHWLDGVIVPSIDHRSQTVMRLRAWLAECTRPLTLEERQQPHKHRGLSATEAADSFNRWARRRGYGPMSAGSLGRWLRDGALCGERFYSLHHKANRYALALRTSAAPAALGVRHG